MLAAAAPQAAGRYSLVPNPAHHTLRVERATGASGPASLVLQDLQGRTVLATALAPNRLAHTLDIAGLAPGLYVIKITASEGSFSQKIAVY